VSNVSSLKESRPNLSPKPETVEFLARILLGGGAQDHLTTNGRSMKISEMLKSPDGGFFDASLYSELSSQAE
jgi:hypothetical protein